MIHQHPFRVLSITALVACAFLALSFPGKHDTSGSWYYLSTIGWFGFLLSTLAFLFIAVTVVVRRRSART